MSRRTHLQLIAHRLAPDDPLRHPDPSRVLLPLSSSPSELLHQLDGRPCWPPLKAEFPSFPPGYPPDLDPFPDPSLLRRAFFKDSSKPLEWLGDALVGLAVSDSLHRHVPDCNKRATDDALTLLWDKNQLGHMALLYGLQCYRIVDRSVRSLPPGVDKMSDIFEAFVGAAALQFGCPTVLNWLATLFDPWVATACLTGCGVASGDAPSTVRSKFQRYWTPLDGVPHAMVPPAWPGPNRAAMSAFGPARVRVCIDARSLLQTTPLDWPPLDINQVDLPEEYPPWPPVFTDPDMPLLNAALTHVNCRLKFGADVPSNQRYKWLGQHLYRTVLTVIAVKTLSAVLVAELNDARVECTNPALLGRMALVFGLQRYVYQVRRANDSSETRLEEMEGSFRALVGAVYVRFGWTELFKWLEPLLLPWIRAAVEGKFQQSKIASHHRQARQDQRDSMEAARRRKQKAQPPGTKALTSVARTAKDTYRHNPPVSRDRRSSVHRPRHALS
ncbi:hypothetical protein DFH08DRAFT_831339 [Mycena albidolilacea]|uniref:RNase III domain-containing protein n=1 Tax=Mycena albidolilacea TaxID=1033008 RepID=A0AAD7F4J9_9AGAR|nr:hypothetical protein DFH08DRAFT_831339 [Mycena albidolilacea]